MTALRDTILNAPAEALALGGFLIGMMFGLIAHRTNYCVMGAVADWRLSGNMGRLGAAALAAATAIAGAQTLDAAGIAQLSQSIYLMPRISVLAAIAGGLIFGFGMVYAGGCPSRMLVRAGSGDLRAMTSLLVLSLAAFVALSGVLGGIRTEAQQLLALDARGLGAETQSLVDLAKAIGLNQALSRWLVAGLAVVVLAGFAFGPARIQSTPRNIAAGFGVGAAVVLGWVLTGLAYDEMAANPLAPASLSFVKPVADAVDWAERMTALGLPSFAAASVFGVLAGAFLSALLAGTLRISGYADAADLKRHLGGTLAMGIGGILGLGCTVGQGVTGLSTLGVQSIIAAAAIISGAVLGIAHMNKTQ